MADKKVNTTRSISSRLTDHEYQESLKRAEAALHEEKKRKIKIPKSFMQLKGSHWPVGINGVFIEVPIGVEVELPAPFVEQLEHGMETVQGTDVVTGAEQD